MKTLHRLALAAACGAALAAPAFAADVGVSVSVNQPGFYGRIDINQPPPPAAVVYAQPVIVAQPAVQVVQQPIYLRVPPGHEKHWSRHCREYNACGVPVYFVRDTYYQQHYVVQEPPRVINGQRVMVVREVEHDHGHDRDDDHDHGHGHGHGKGHGKHDD
jgi:hypothetical protein